MAVDAGYSSNSFALTVGTVDEEGRPIIIGAMEIAPAKKKPLNFTHIYRNLIVPISGAGKTFETFPDILDNVIPYIGGEEEKSEQEPLKLWGHIEGDKIVSAESPRFTAQCLRVPVSDGHMGAVFVRFENKPSKEEILQAWKEFHGPAQDLELPSAPKQFLHYFEENDRPQPKLDRMLENGMAVSIGRLREDNQYDYKFVCLSHNTLRGAAGGAVLLAELLAAKGYFD
jgi:aspartate-semialdehyde dehydrogenase